MRSDREVATLAEVEACLGRRRALQLRREGRLRVFNLAPGAERKVLRAWRREVEQLLE